MLSADGRSLLVSHLRSSKLTVLDLASGQIERTLQLSPAGAASEAVALAQLGDEIWVALRPPQPSKLPGALRRLDAATLSPLSEMPTGADPGALLALPERGTVLVSNFESDSVTEHDRSGLALRHIVAPGPLGLTALRSGEVLALDYYSNSVSLVDPASNSSRTVPLARGGVPFVNPTNAAFSSDGRSAWIVSSGTDGHLLALDLASMKIVRDLPVEGLSFGIAVVPGAVF